MLCYVKIYGTPYKCKHEISNGSIFVKRSDSQLILDAIRRIVRALRNFSKASERDFGLGTAQIFVLQKLMESGKSLTINELAEATLTHQSSVSVVVSKLVSRKLIDRTTDKNDTRSVRISITPEGKYLLTKSPPSFQERLTRAISEMSSRQRKGLIDGLQSLIAKAGMEDDEAPMLMED